MKLDLDHYYHQISVNFRDAEFSEDSFGPEINCSSVKEMAILLRRAWYRWRSFSTHHQPFEKVANNVELTLAFRDPVAIKRSGELVIVDYLQAGTILKRVKVRSCHLFNFEQGLMELFDDRDDPSSHLLFTGGLCVLWTTIRLDCYSTLDQLNQTLRWRLNHPIDELTAPCPFP